MIGFDCLDCIIGTNTINPKLFCNKSQLVKNLSKVIRFCFKFNYISVRFLNYS